METSCQSWLWNHCPVPLAVIISKGRCCDNYSIPSHGQVISEDKFCNTSLTSNLRKLIFSWGSLNVWSPPPLVPFNWFALSWVVETRLLHVSYADELVLAPDGHVLRPAIPVPFRLALLTPLWNVNLDVLLQTQRGNNSMPHFNSQTHFLYPFSITVSDSTPLPVPQIHSPWVIFIFSLLLCLLLTLLLLLNLANYSSTSPASAHFQC